MKSTTLSFASLLLLSACTNDGDIYDANKHSKEDFSVEKTILLGIGAAAAAAAAAACSDGYCGGGGSTTVDYDWDWDYQPANTQWVCRGIQTGQYAELSDCAYDVQDDDRWPG